MDLIRNSSGDYRCPCGFLLWSAESNSFEVVFMDRGEFWILSVHEDGRIVRIWAEFDKNGEVETIKHVLRDGDEAEQWALLCIEDGRRRLAESILKS